ncbi:MAG: zinc-ribbon domain-containing protein [Novosphingobium sp.]|nr:zinc-ribbon domain-containing protein [Novosphingobium sp.]
MEKDYQDIKIICKDCNKEFTFTAGEQKFYEEKGFQSPVRCKECRQSRKEKFGNKDDMADLRDKFKNNTVNF